MLGVWSFAVPTWSVSISLLSDLRNSSLADINSGTFDLLPAEADLQGEVLSFHDDFLPHSNEDGKDDRPADFAAEALDERLIQKTMPRLV